MKKLRFFDSLKFVVAVVATTFILNVAHADTSINSVIAYGKTEQNGTPTPTNPVPIMTNNGVLKVRPNLFNRYTVGIAGGAISSANGKNTSSASRCRTIGYVPVNPNTTYTVSAVIDGYTGSSSAGVFVLEYTADSGDFESNYTGTSSGWKNPVGYTFTTGSTTHGIRFVFAYSSSGEISPSDITNIRLEEGSTATTEIYVDGLTETIRDSAGHTATAEMLLSVGDYKDEQNINTGAITRKVGVKVLDGSESWELYNWDAQNVRDVMRVTLSSIAPDAKNNLSTAEQLAVIKCTHLEQRGVSAFNGDVSGFAWATKWFDTTARVAIRVAGITTVAQFKQWLADQYAAGTPVIIVYPLATETTEPAAVAPQRLTTAPVRQTLGAIMNMPIKTILTDNTEIMSGANELIKIATTKYNEESFEDVQDALTGVFNAVDTVVTQTMDQAQAIDTIATTKQTRPNEGCTAKYCLLVEGEDGTPHWYPIAGANGVAHNLPAGYTELQYLQGSGTQNIITDLTGFDTGNWEIYTKFMSTSETQTSYGYIGRFIMGNQLIHIV